MKHKSAILILIGALSLQQPAAANTYNGTDMFSLMFRMMLTMMNVMSSAGNSSNSFGWPANSYWSSMSGMGGWPAMSSLYGLGGWPGMNSLGTLGGWPGMNSFSGLGGYPGWMGPPWASVPGRGVPYPDVTRGTSLLNGRWYGNTGEILEISGNRFRLRSGQLTLTGVLKVANNILSLYGKQTGTVQHYQFVRNQTNLMLQDQQGQVLVFTRRSYGSAYPLRAYTPSSHARRW
jgi:hypothetical protein